MKKLKNFHNKDPWILGEDIPNCDLFFSQIWLSSFVNEFKWPSGKAYNKILCIYRGYHLWFYFGEKDSYDVGEHIVNKFVKNPDFALKVNDEIVKWADNLRECVDKISMQNFKELSDKKLYQLFKKHDDVHTDYYRWGWIPVAADMFHNNLTDRLKKYLLLIGVSNEKVNEYLAILTSPINKSLIQKEQENLIKIGIEVQRNKPQYELFKQLFKHIKEKEISRYGLKTHSEEYERMLEERVSEVKDRIDEKIYKKLEKHYIDNFYMKYLFTEKQGVYSFDYYLKELVRIVASQPNLSVKLKEMQDDFRKSVRKRSSLLKKLNINGSWKKIFDAYSGFMVTKIYRRYSQVYALYCMEGVLREIGKRLGLTLMQVKFMLPDEINKALLGGKINKNNIKKRTKYCVYYAEKGNDSIYIGDRAKKLALKTSKGVAKKEKDVSGQCGCVGKAKGEVKIIIEPKDMDKMKKGDILVSIATNPDLITAMKKAAAIVTDQGGVTSHAAIVSRELNIPCVIGTKIATQALKDGDRIEVNATNGIVKKL